MDTEGEDVIQINKLGSTWLFACKECNRTFKSHWNLRRHAQKLHPNFQICHLEGRRGRKPKDKCYSVVCKYCSKTYSNRQSLIRHCQTAHSNCFQLKKPHHCPDENCNESFKRRTYLMDHLRNHHKNEFGEFKIWLSEEEKKACCHYRKETRDVKTGNGVMQYYSCFRSGYYKSRGRGIRKLRLQGSCKINSFCPAYLKVEISFLGSVKGIYCATHIGHEKSLSYLKSQNWKSCSEELHSIYSSCYSNVSSSNELPFLQENVFQYIKLQGEKCIYGLDYMDFMLVIMTELQISVFSEFAKEGMIVLIDSTHSVKQSAILLTSLIVIGHNDDCFPVAFCYSNRVDKTTMEVFFTTVKRVLGGQLESVVLMTDDTMTYANAWSSVMGHPVRILLSSWYVDNDWRKNIAKIKGNTDLKSTIYKTLRSILISDEKDNFCNQLDNFLTDLKQNNSTLKFCQYFEKFYAERPDVWAYCYRSGMEPYHHLNLECMHRELMKAHFEKLKAKDLDKSIQSLLAYLTKKSLECLQFQMTYNSKESISKSDPEETGVKCVALESEECWNVYDSKSDFYVVKKVNCNHDYLLCKVNCLNCKICVHCYVCNCFDGLHQLAICDHMHAVCRFNGSPCNIVNNTEFTHEWDDPSTSETVDSLVLDVTKEINELNKSVQCVTNVQVLNSVHKQVTVMVKLLDVLKDGTNKTKDV